MKNRSSYIVIAHGSRDPKANEEFLELIKNFRSVWKPRNVCGCFLELVDPSIEECVKAEIEEGVEEFFVMPLMFFSGRHVREHIPDIFARLKLEFPQVQFHFSPPVGNAPQMIEMMKDLFSSLEQN